MAINLDHVTEQITVTDTATNASLTVNPKGTGAFNIAAGSSGLNLSNGGTITAFTRTALGAYTSNPSVAISAPTTAGGVQATGTAIIQNNSATIVNGGTGYTVGDTITLVGGTLATGGAGTFRVASVSGGVITGFDTSNFAQYSVAPTNPVSVTGGTGSGATLTVSYIFGYIVSSNAGSGYVEQPTITFSGGGGSGAAAYATVGSGTAIRALGATGTQSLDFYTPASASNGVPVLRLRDTSGGDSYTMMYVSSNSASLLAQGNTNANLKLGANSAGSVVLTTFGGGQSTQFQASHTASAVNYVQATGAPTGSSPVISAQGSDSNIQIQLQAKGTGLVRFTTGGGLQAYVSDTVSAVNYHQFTGSATGFGPVHTVSGSDTNIPLVLQPKGTGALQANQTDSTATGGNARGSRAVDLQMGRDSASQVADGAGSVIGGGYANRSGGNFNVVAGGNNNTATYSFGVIGGGVGNSLTANSAVIAGGASNVITFSPGNNWSFIGAGQVNTAHGVYNLTVGGYGNSGTSGTSVTTQSATMNGTTAVTLSGSNASIKVGQYIIGTSIAADTYVAAISGTSLTLSKVASGSSTSTLSFYTPHGVVVGGGNNIASGSYSFVGAGGDAGNTANRNVASGDWSAVVGGIKNTASGKSSFIGGGGADANGNILANLASGVISFIGGGFNSTASAQGTTIAGGASHLASGQYGAIMGGARGSTRAIEGNHVFPACVIPIADGYVSQAALLILARQTTDATATLLTSNGNTAASTNNQVILPNNSAYFFTGEIVSGVTGGGNTKGWTIEGVIKRGANAASTTLVGSTVTSMYADIGAATWTIAVTADTTNGGLAVTFTGQAATTIRTVAQIRTTEMTF